MAGSARPGGIQTTTRQSDPSSAQRCVVYPRDHPKGPPTRPTPEMEPVTDAPGNAWMCTYPTCRTTWIWPEVSVMWRDTHPLEATTHIASRDLAQRLRGVEAAGFTEHYLIGSFMRRLVPLARCYQQECVGDVELWGDPHHRPRCTQTLAADPGSQWRLCRWSFRQVGETKLRVALSRPEGGRCGSRQGGDNHLDLRPRQLRIILGWRASQLGWCCMDVFTVA